MENENQTLEERILTPILEYFMGIEDIDNYVANSIIKQRVDTIGRMQIIIHSNDHDPPHFHVKSKDGEVNAKFTIKDCEHIWGMIDPKDEKRVRAFHSNIKAQLILTKIWNKRLGNKEQ